MKNRNKMLRTATRWTHLLLGWLIGVFVYTPAREDDTFVLLMQVVFVPAVVLTGVWMWQQARIRRLYKRLRQGTGVWQRMVLDRPTGKPGRAKRGRGRTPCKLSSMSCAGRPHKGHGLPLPQDERKGL